MESDRDYCLRRLRTYDYDRYFSCLLAPAPARRSLIALYAFNLEIASVRELVSDRTLGEIRLQWWRDAVAAAGEGRPVRHAVAAELGPVVAGLSAGALHRLIDARSRDLDDAVPVPPAALEAHARDTAGALAGLACRICRGEAAPPAVAAAGTAWGLAGFLRSIPFRAAVTGGAERGTAVPGGPEGAAAVAATAARARALLAGARGGLAGLDRPGRAAVAYLPLASLYLARLGRAGHDARAPGLEPGRTVRQFAMLRAALTGRF